jgi:hypothetical protein
VARGSFQSVRAKGARILRKGEPGAPCTRLQALGVRDGSVSFTGTVRIRGITPGKAVSSKRETSERAKTTEDLLRDQKRRAAGARCDVVTVTVGDLLVGYRTTARRSHMTLLHITEQLGHEAFNMTQRYLDARRLRCPLTPRSRRSFGAVRDIECWPRRSAKWKSWL